MRAFVILGSALVLAAGCSNRDTVAVSGTDGGGGGRDAYCDGSGPPLLIDTDGGTICSGDLASRAFERALCACGGYAAGGDLLVDSFDSREGPYEPGQGGGDVGMNAKLDTSAAVDVGGELVVTGGDGILGGTTITVGGDLVDDGELGRSGTAVDVGGDARVGGNITLSSLTVTGTLTQPAGTTRNVSGTTDLGATATGDVTPAAPCDCEPGSLVDVAGLVEAHRYDNHNAAIDLDPLALADVTGDASLSLPCGRFFLDRIEGTQSGTLTIEATGRVALFVGQGVNLQQSLRVDVAPDAELDLFIAGHVNTAGFVTVGNPDTPRHARVYIGGAGAINLSADTAFAGNLYAPLIDLTSSAPITFFGSTFVNRLNTSAGVTIHHDRATPTQSCQ